FSFTGLREGRDLRLVDAVLTELGPVVGRFVGEDEEIAERIDGDAADRAGLAGGLAEVDGAAAAPARDEVAGGVELLDATTGGSTVADRGDFGGGAGGGEAGGVGFDLLVDSTGEGDGVGAA